MGKSGLIGIIGVAVALSACSATETPPVVPTASTSAPDVLDYAQATQPVGSRMPQDGDLCRASENQHLVGKPRDEIPVPVDVINRRVACTTCAITEDYSPYRLNIFFNQETGRVEEVRCG